MCKEKEVYCCSCYFYHYDNDRGPSECMLDPHYRTSNRPDRPTITRVRICVSTKNKNNDCKDFREPDGFVEKFKKFFNCKR
jgi:hypothetical protein